jgi:hypothetical protein
VVLKVIVVTHDAALVAIDILFTVSDAPDLGKAKYTPELSGEIAKYGP